MEIIREEFIKLDINLENKKEVIDYIANLLINSNRVRDKGLLLKDVYLREEEASTSMGLGIAIPHAKSLSVKEPTVVFLRLNESIKWNEDKDIKMIFGIFVPAENVDNQHLKILSSLSRKLTDEQYREALLKVKSIKDSERLLQGLNAS
ncbi:MULTISPECIES: PTS sugar transporter subunit IIA [Oceanobacillus]|uniref:PTS fructose transporter subunit IIA n=1 Tax=Oceanobacillus neutriphilus TaxID=531815 RepID=A0ABQ2NQ34_9BACI|nr:MULTISPECIES: fructose PTS transporter subunit IIA [Oceanobacillus]MCT1901921.1 fructose PTS transporter subunit IIA [Oceanobacillus sojae]GGP07821.1 PTS fructose transporter subunit IIA [Oceanobacillus neutriphilus]